LLLLVCLTVYSIAKVAYYVNVRLVVYTQHLNKTMIVVNLQQLGPVPHRFCSAEELRCVMETAEEIMDQTETDVMTEILADWETALTWDSLTHKPVTEEWYYRALLVTCIRGLRGEMRPNFYTIPPRD
jgi:hypothetical protein